MPNTPLHDGAVVISDNKIAAACCMLLGACSEDEGGGTPAVGILNVSVTPAQSTVSYKCVVNDRLIENTNDSVQWDVTDAAFRMVQEMMDDSLELISIYYGAEVTEEAAGILKDRIEEAFPSCDVELQYGGQPIYYYIISAE